MAEKTKKARRGRNEGSIRWVESKKLWEARFPVGIREDGKTKYKSIYGKNKTKLLAQMRDALAALGKGEYVDASSKPLITWCKEWFELYKKPDLRINTREKYLTSITRLQRYDIANIPLKNLNQEIIQTFYNRLAEDGFSEETIKATHSLINGALEKAEELKMVIKNEARKCKIPKDDMLGDEAEEKNAKALTEEEEKAFLEQVGKRSKYYMYAVFMLNTGLRPGEALALTRKDINIKNKTVKVTKTYIEKIKKVQNAPKTKSSFRTVPIPDNVLNLLIEYMLKQPNKEPNAPLFQTNSGKRPTMSYLRKRFKFAGEKAGVPWVNLHTMRHTYASKLFKKKIDIKIISQLLGHKDVSTTYDIYIHFIDNVVEESVKVLNEGLPEKLPEKNQKPKDNITPLKKVSTH
ncbi:tyrosine recombinase XerC-like protein [Thermoclostridium stercorarium subsp. stercorarium DSM 8532]|uniref:Tyrosine recombinase XerC-like protein n=1 Tax=Thermoclostridium stercorarium (strain ATCC 35414 / DSM 8532 / NCIMB 11754) TaxID=1121335 RepID=L7VKY2_THES1|nr:tyrosine-type recombinase/integrase [Thermoclostridium stercorarium]AGC67407.1 tyrosine recombinase XerC-like protein [Thermoclostridium stercorarium subsp. stercorarium DSM 8532]AGI38468.1 XerD [Thermoclostridium stercorarium subsp. stercorarium DSM 8532]UZQ85997.1 site-specific integrase [Thermoclostridium stercorarium]